MGPFFRYEPLGPHRFPVGQGPFRARGLAYVVALKYVDGRLPGGRQAFVDALGPDDPFAPFYQQIFLVSGDYDVSPLVRLYEVCARIERAPLGRFIEERARWSAESDTKGLWKPMLKADSPEGAAERTRLAFMRYFPPCQAVVLSLEPGRFEGELSQLPSPMSGVYTSATAGFVAAALTLAGASSPRVEWDRQAPDGALQGIPLEKARFVATWR
jgi:hypothetical protein